MKPKRYTVYGNGATPYNESFNGKLRDECLNMEIFTTLKEAQVLIEQWRSFYNTERPHSALGYRPPAPQAILPSTNMTADPSGMIKPEQARL